MNSHELELINVVYHDLIFVRDHSGPKSTENDLRNISAQLRRLLVDEQLRKAWTCLGFTKQPAINALPLDIDNLSSDQVAIAIGGIFDDARISQLSITNRVKTPEEIKASYEQSKKRMETPSIQSLPLNKYLKSCGVFVYGEKISIEWVVKYIANKRGGVHLDASRDEDHQYYLALDKIESAFRVGGTLDEKTRKLKGYKNPFYAEILSIG